MAFATEFQITLFTDVHRGFAGRLEPFAGIEFFWILKHELASRRRHGQADVGVDVDLAHAVLDGFLNFRHGHAECRFHLAAVLVDDGQQVLRHAARAVHDQVGVGDARVNFFDATDGQDVAGGLACELVRAVAGANRNRQGIELCGFDKLCGFFGVGQHLAVVEFAHGADAVFFTRFARF